MDNQLPTEFDLVVVGTGLVESIVSAAASRIGKNVLHIDSNDYYGGLWASFNLKALHSFSEITHSDNTETPNFFPLGNDVIKIRNFQSQWHIPEDIKREDINISEETNYELSDKINEEELKTSTCEIKDEAPMAKPETTKKKVEHSQQSILKDSRKFNIDLVPKLHFARGDFVELLISSNIARYAEFRSVSRVLTCINNQLEIVPCSRSDVFSNNKVSVIEKRMLMKLFTSLHENTDNFKDENTTFYQFLQDRKLSPNLIDYVLYAMSRSTKETTLVDGIHNTRRFMNSLGRFGKTPFLFSMYGSGETSQAFCRLSAVFGGVFALNQKSMSGIHLKEGKATVLQNGAQEIKADHFVIGAEESPKEFIKSIEIKENIARAILITDQSILPTEQEHLTLLMYPPENGKNIVTIVEMGSQTGTCPNKNLFLVHLTAKQIISPKGDFQHIINNLFRPNNDEQSKPNILWSCFFSIPDTNHIDLNANLPENIYLCSGPDLDLDYDLSIKKAKEIFQKMYPDLEFLPRAPDPEEIVIGDDISPEDEPFPTNISDFKEENHS